MANSITIRRGQTANIPVIRTVSGVQTSLSGIRLLLTAKSILSDADAAALIAQDITVGGTGTLTYTFILTPAETLALPTGNLIADFKMFDGTTQILTETFIIEVLETVTHRIV